MAIVTKEDVLKIARMSNIKIHDQEVASLVDRLGQVLSYAARVQEIAVNVDIPPSKNINIFREDVAVRFDSQTILARAPECQENYFVVPAILEK